MKIFSNKNRTRLFTLLLGGVMCASTAAGVFSLVGNKTAAADEYAKPETTKIETLVDARTDLRLSTSYANVAIDYYDINKSEATANISGKKTFAVVYDKTGYNTNNPVDYDGNVGLWINARKTESDTGSTADNSNMGFKLQSSAITNNGGYGIISFRTKWTTGNGTMSLGMMTPTNSAYVRWADNGKNGYWIALQESTVQIVEYNTDMTYMVENASYTNTPANGENLIITYGIWQSAETARSIYLKVEKTDGTVCYENTVVDSDITGNTVTANGTFTIAKGDASYNNIKDDEGNIIEPVLLIAGVDEPLMKNTALTEGKKFTVGSNLSDVTLTNEDYALVDTTGTVLEGTNTYDVKIANYYGTATGKVGTVSITSRADMSAYSQYTEKLEDLVNGKEDVSVGTGFGSLINMETSTSAGNCNQGMIEYAKASMAFYDETANAGGLLDYDGNVAIELDKEAGVAPYRAATMQFDGQTEYAETNGNGYGIISFRTKYETTSNAYLSLGMMINKDGVYSLADRYCNNYYGYWFKVTGSTITAWKYTADNTAPTDITNTEYTGFEVAPENNDKLIVSYGVLKTSETVNTLYLKIEKVNADNSVTLCYEGIHVDDQSSTPVLVPANPAFQFSYGNSSTANLTANPVLLVAGVDKPLMTDKYSLTETDYEVNEDEALPTLTETGYSWVDTTAVYGTSEYAANYSFDYYGKTVSVPVTVEVNVIGQRVTLKLMNGTTELYTASVKVGNTVNFATLDLDNVDTIIGWKLGDSTDLLRSDTVFTAEAAMVDSEVVYNVVDMDMKQYEKGSIRTTVDANGNGGLRFVGMFNTADWTANADYIVNAYGVIVPADDDTYYTEANGFTAAALAKGAENPSLKGMTALAPADLGLTGMDGYSLYTVTLTNVKYANYNRTFASMTYITVQYANGSTATFETNVAKRSVYEVAIAAKAAQEDSVTAGTPLYSNEQMKVIEGYVANVIDVTNDGTTFAVVDRESHGIARTYALVSGSVDGETVTLTLTAAANSLLATNENAPVWYNGVRYKAAVSYADGTATVTFTVVE